MTPNYTVHEQSFGGSWYIKWYIKRDGKLVAVIDPDDNLTTKEAAMVARVFGTAFEMLTVLKLVELRLNQVQSDHGTRANDLRDYLLPPVHAAIAKAEVR